MRPLTTGGGAHPILFQRTAQPLLWGRTGNIAWVASEAHSPTMPTDFDPRRDLDSERQEARTALLLGIITALLFAIVVLAAAQRFA